MVGHSRKMQGAIIHGALSEGIGKKAEKNGRISEAAARKTKAVPALLEKQSKEAGGNGKWSHNGIDLSGANSTDWAQDMVCIN